MFFNSYSLGDKKTVWKTNDVLIQVHFRDPFWELTIGYPSITEEEIEELRFGDIKMAITNINGSLFFLFSFGRIPWCDAPYEPRITDVPLNYSIIDDKGQGAPLLVCIVDSAMGELKALRLVGMGHILSNRLHAVCREIDARRPLDKKLYDQNIQRVYKKYPSSDMMLRTVNPIDIFALVNLENP